MFLGDLLAAMKKGGSDLSTPAAGDWGTGCQNVDVKTADNTTRDKFYELMPQVSQYTPYIFCCKKNGPSVEGFFIVPLNESASRVAAQFPNFASLGKLMLEAN